MRHTKKGINAAAWFYTNSFHNAPVAPKPEPQKTNLQPVERWDGQKWVTVFAKVGEDSK
jgi:hypothetical protein